MLDALLTPALKRASDPEIGGLFSSNRDPFSAALAFESHFLGPESKKQDLENSKPA